jgi:hypothetical protein
MASYTVAHTSSTCFPPDQLSYFQQLPLQLEQEAAQQQPSMDASPQRSLLPPFGIAATMHQPGNGLSYTGLHMQAPLGVLPSALKSPDFGARYGVNNLQAATEAAAAPVPADNVIEDQQPFGPDAKLPTTAGGIWEWYDTACPQGRPCVKALQEKHAVNGKNKNWWCNKTRLNNRRQAANMWTNMQPFVEWILWEKAHSRSPPLVSELTAKLDRDFKVLKDILDAIPGGKKLNWTSFGRQFVRVYVLEARDRMIDSWQAFMALPVDELKIRQEKHKKGAKGDDDGLD